MQERGKFIQIVIGPRQVGKTTGIKEVLSRLNRKYIYASADEVISPNPDWIVENWQRARSLGDGTILVIDEVQKIHNWSGQVKYLYDALEDPHSMKIILTGSASLSLGDKSKESLAGRFELIEVPHWSFAEMRQAFNFNLAEFLKFGGYPSPVELKNDLERWRSYIKSSIVEPVLYRDVQSLVRIDKPALFQQVVALSMHYPAQEISFQKFVGQLQDSGNLATVKNYLEILEQAFFLKLLYKFSTRPISTRSSSPKILSLCPALTSIFNNPNDLDSDKEWFGHCLESAVGARLSRLGGELTYWRDGKFEVDFVIQKDRKILAVEVKSGRRKGLNGVEKFLSQFKGSKAVLADRTLAEQILLEESDQKLLEMLYKIAVGA